MEKFVHKSVRLYCNLLEAYRMFTIEEKLKLWLSKNILIDEENFKIEINHNSFELNTLGSKITRKEYEKKIVINWIEKEKSINSEVEINFMTCSQRAVNCVEIHVIHRNLNKKYMNFYNVFWKESLDSLRYYFNKDWIIHDGDLTLTKITGRSL